MNFIVDYETKKKKMLDKIDSKDFHFTEEERFFLENVSEVKYHFYSVLGQSRNLWNSEVRSLVLTNIDFPDLPHISEEALCYCCYDEIDNGKIATFPELMEYTTKQKEILEYFSQKLDDPNYVPSGELDDNIGRAILEKGRYELFYNFKASFSTLSSDIVEKIINHYPYDFTTLPIRNPDTYDTCISYVNNKPLEYQNVYDMIRHYEEPEKYFPLLKNKLFLENAKIDKPIPIPNFFSDFYEMFNADEKAKFLEKLLESRNIIDYFNFAPLEEIEKNLSLISKIMKEDDCTVRHIRDDKLLNNDVFVEALLESHNLEHFSRSPLAPKYISKLVSLVENGDSKYRNLEDVASSVIMMFKDYPELFRRLLRANFIKSTWCIDYDIKCAGLEDIFLEEVFENNVPIFLTHVNKEEDLERFIRGGSIDSLIMNAGQFPDLRTYDQTISLPEDCCDKLIECIKDNLNYQQKIFAQFPGLIFENPKILDFYVHSCPMMLEAVLETINHQETLSHLYTDQLYHTIKGYFSEKNALPVENLDKIETLFGPFIIRYIDNDTLGEICKLQSEELDKLLALFPKTEHSLSSIENIYDSLKQYAFSKEHPETVQIFATIMHSISDEDSIYIEEIEKLISVMDEKFYHKFGKKYPELVESCRQNPKEFLNQIAHVLKKGEPEEKTYVTDVLHTITDYYIAIEREKYRDNYHMVEELNLQYDLDPKDTQKQLMSYCFEVNPYQTFEDEKSVRVSDIALTKLVEGGMKLSLATDVVRYYIKWGNYTNDLDLIKKNVRYLIPILKEIVNQIPEELKNKYIEFLDKENRIKRNYKVPKTEIDMYQILTTLRVDSLKNHVFSDKEVYNSLLATMQKYKLHTFPPCFKSLLESKSVQISSDLNALSGFLSYYHQVYETEKKKLESQGKNASSIQLTIPNILINAEVLSGVSSVYNQFLGKEDAQIIKANMGPNSATNKTAKDQRLKEAVDWTIKNFKRMEVTVPTFSQNIKIDEKEMRVVIGNFTHPSNLTHGERTGACMRIGGVGETLFDFCLEDKNGFHIRFEDNQTGEYISRVSGFRNGNTVFLNELRNSCNQKLFTDQNVVDACIEVSKKLIEFSKESESPIENVVVYKAYATIDMKLTNLEITNNKLGLKHFYSDIQGNGIILASTGTPFVPINFDKSHIPTYLPAREKIYVGEDSIRLMEMINRVDSVHKVLDGFDYEYIEPLTVESIIYGMASQDWYIYIDSEGNIHEDCIPIDKRAEEELKIARQRIAEYVPEKESSENYHL